MAEASDVAYRPTDPVGRILLKISIVLAVLGGVLLSVMAVVMTLSIAGRFLLNAPVPGDYELIAIGTGISVFAFLPYCQITRGNVLVDFFMSGAPPRVKAFCDVLGSLLYAAIATLLTWRMIYGGIDMYNYGERSITVNFPRWTTFPVSILFLAFLIVVTVYTFCRSIHEARTGEHYDR